ncbi:MAG TPA: HAMP domain-containing sensor histidine kinase, partial [Actinomycetota bacterium]|nr:HAMP domain-containing sensor histidine kinase [Actinomycetota bacterium]
LVASLLVGLRLSSSVVRPLRALEEATLTLARGDLSSRAPSEGGPPEVRSVARAFNEMAGRLEELVGAQSQFVADASHQLRTPLTALKLRLENIEESAQGSVQRDAEAAGRELWRLQHIVDGLLTLARAEGARPQRQIEDVRAVLGSRREAWQPLADERNITLRVEVPDAITVHAIAGGLEQILDNLLANAIEASPAGTPIVMRSRRTGEWVEVFVSDQGPGMTPGERKHAFDRFWRASSGGGSGSGLGLSIVRQLARASGGDVTLEASAAGGIDAIVRLPAG